MRYSNETKVGAAVLISVVIFFLGVRFFEDLPLFRSTNTYIAEFDHAGGLIPGNVVRVSGVSVGSVTDVAIAPESGRVRVLFQVDEVIPVTQGSIARIAGFDALGVVRMELVLGPPGAPLIPDGGALEGQAASDLFAELSSQAPQLAEKLDVVLSRMDVVLGEAGMMLSQPESDLRQTLSSVQSTTETLEALLQAERERIGVILANVESMTGGLDSLVQESGHDLPQTLSRLNATLTTLDEALVGLRGTSARLDTLLDKLNGGEGTLGRLINDPEMYRKIDSTLTALNALMADFEANPGKYLGEMRIIDLF